MWCKLEPTTVYYEAIGEGGPIVFLHGWSLDHTYELADFEPIFSKRGGWQRIYLDLPGCGRTKGSERIRDQDAILGVVLAFVDRVLGTRRFVLAGSSAGAYLARGVARKRPASVDGLLLRVPMIVADDQKRTLPTFVPLIRDPELMAGLGDDAIALSEVLIEKPSYIDALRARMESLVIPPMGASDATFLTPIREDPARYGFSVDVDAGAAPFRAPTLIIAGRQDTSVGYQDAWQLLEQYPRATFVVLDRADHTWPVDDHRLLEALVDEWLDRVSEFR